MSTDPATPTTDHLPPGYRVLNDGPGREVLFREEWDEGEVFQTRAEAILRARCHQRITESKPPPSQKFATTSEFASSHPGEIGVTLGDIEYGMQAVGGSDALAHD